MAFERFDIAGDKVRLRPISKDDAQARYNLFQNEAVLTWLSTEGYRDLAEMYHRLQAAVADWQAGKSYTCAVERLQEPGFIGNISIRFRIHPRQADIGYWLGEPYWNHGYMTEATRLVCHICFQHLNVNKVCATVFAGNAASRRVLEKNSFSLDGTIKRYFYKRGEWKDGWFFSLLREEWETRKGYYLPRFEDIVVKPDEP